MQRTISTAQLAELLGVAEKTIAAWAKAGVAVRVRHGVYDLGQTLQNWTAYQKMLHKGCDRPLENWWIQRDLDWSEAHPLPPIDFENLVLTPIEDLETQRFEVETDAEGRIVAARPASE